MNIKYPHKIQNCIGETLIFKEVLKKQEGDRLLVHWLQDESLTVVKGRLGYEIQGQPKKYIGEGETILFKKGTPHRFWNDGQEVLHCKGRIKPANTIVFFLTSIFAAQNKSGKARPEKFDAAYLMTRYSSEYDLPEVPAFVKRTIIPITYRLGKLLGKYKHFNNAPYPIQII